MFNLILISLSILAQSEGGDNLLFLSAERLPEVAAYGTVYKIDLSGRTATPVYEKERTLTEVKYSPVSGRVLVSGFDQRFQWRLDIIDVNGTPINSVKNAVSGAFIDKGGLRMAYTKGIKSEDEPMKSMGTWIRASDASVEEKIWDHGTWVEMGQFNGALYIRDTRQSPEYHVYYIDMKKFEGTELSYGGFSPRGTYRWGYKNGAGTTVFRGETSEEVSTDLTLLNLKRHGTPPLWMSDSILMLPHYMNELEDYLLYVETGKTLKAPGRVLSLTDDEQFVYICKPGLVIEKVPMTDLEVLYEGKSARVETGTRNHGNDAPQAVTRHVRTEAP